MKTIGLIGGMSWESSALYYQIINRKIQHVLGGVHSCNCLMYSVDFAEIAHLQHTGSWDLLAKKMISVAQKLELGGADMILLCTNTMHKVAERIEHSINIPFLHIVDATAEQIQKKSYNRLGLLATRFSMEEDFLKARYKNKFNIETMVPDEKARVDVHRIIYEELVKGIITHKSKQRYLEIIDHLVQNGAQAIISGCTEIELLISPSDISVDLFQTTRIHAEKAVEMALQ
ncbi:aspartate/glutamate racemase family protein [Rhodocytophaga aerolata]|uniref:Aspartate/glutamate racemase family protein n=1 Tax=Rhodocytophaga aerolata TaxID=455078 RepID=A0ABT8RHH5_9BACT|nr:aspartate/glutamate racemase family protein [Rhodocytophaga aerolata]MDO1450834.1 aspartate/glutamate racemase family protein [Rhodocytophaga aerolata]